MVNIFARHICFDAINSADYGAIVDGSQSYVGPERDFTIVEVPGRNGDLTVDNGRFKNVEIRYVLFFYEAARLEAYRENIKSLTGYHRLEDSRRPDEYRLARLSSGFDPTMFGSYNRSGEVEIVFDCQPQRFLKSGEAVLTFAKSGSVWNPSRFASKPLLRVYGSGGLTIGTETITIGAHSHERADIDCELGECTSGSVNLNRYVQLSGRDFPTLGAGYTNISFGGSITKVEIVPRWWRI